jgi:D-alanine-D-alanine ligase
MTKRKSIVKWIQVRGHEVLAIDTGRGILDPNEEKLFVASRVPALPPITDELALIRSAATEPVSSRTLNDADIVFVALHGGMGEDGRLQAFLDIAGIPFLAAPIYQV